MTDDAKDPSSPNDPSQRKDPPSHNVRRATERMPLPPGPDETGPDLTAPGDVPVAGQTPPLDTADPDLENANSADDDTSAKNSTRKPGRIHLPWEDWGHIPHTRIRTSTAVLVGVFVALLMLYGYTSERYGIVEPAPAPRPPATTTPYIPPPVEESPTTSETSVSPTSPDESMNPSDTTETTPTDGTQGRNSDGEETGSESTPPTTGRSVPGLPGVTVPNFGLPGQTSEVPER